MSDAHEERLARNEAFFRDLNEQIKQVAARLGGDTHRYEFVCECSDTSCSERISLTLLDYERVRAGPTRFVLAPGHVTGQLEHVVVREPEHVIVEKDGPAGELAASLDPRAS